MIRDTRDDIDYRLEATMYYHDASSLENDNLLFDEQDSKIIHNLLKKGNKLKFYIEELGRYASSTYSFNVELEGYGEIYKELSK